MDEIIKKMMKLPMTGDELVDLAGGKVKIVTNDEIGKYNSLKDLVKPYGNIIILYEKRKNVGHWVLFMDRGDHYEYFDPYGFPIDYPLELFGGEPYLSELIARQNKKVFYNKERLQKLSDGVSSCGRWCAMRLILKHADLLTFIKLFKKNKLPPDFYITALTLFANK